MKLLKGVLAGKNLCDFGCLAPFFLFFMLNY